MKLYYWHIHICCCQSGSIGLSVKVADFRNHTEAALCHPGNSHANCLHLKRQPARNRYDSNKADEKECDLKHATVLQSCPWQESLFGTSCNYEYLDLSFSSVTSSCNKYLKAI